MSRIPFNVSARTARLIGQENFANAQGAVIELVKNCYDADSRLALIAIDVPNNKLYIIDNGTGMSEDIILNYWMTIGTDNKAKDIFTSSGRVKTGAKGIGRFALDRLGSHCRLITKTAETEFGWDWDVDWDQFGEEGKVLADIKADLNKVENCNILEIARELIHDFSDLDGLFDNWSGPNGSIIQISGLRDDWNDKDVSDLFSNLEILIPPLSDSLFSIWLFDIANSEKYGKIISANCDDYDYKIEATVTSDRKIKIILSRNELDLQGLKRVHFFETLDKYKLSQQKYSEDSFISTLEFERTFFELLPGLSNTAKSDLVDKIGPFTFYFFFLKRGGGQDKEDDSNKYPYKSVNYRDRSSWLDKFGGIKIFRDNFRVRPYGETNSSSFDWLDLGKRALSNPTVTRPGYRVRPQQIYGIINISRIDNINFEDKSSREGLQENEVFNVFKELIKSIINIFEDDRNQIMITLFKIDKENNKNKRAKEEADELLRKKEEQESKFQTEENDAEATNPEVESTDTDNEDDQHSTEDFNNLLLAYKSVKEDNEELKDEQKLLKVLASAGLIITSFVHELNNLSESIVPRTEELKKLLEQVIDKGLLSSLPNYFNPYVMLDDMRDQDKRLKTWLDFSLAAIRKDKRTRKKIDLVEYIEQFERMWSSLLEKKGIDLVINKSNFSAVYWRGFEIDLDGIFNNLIANSAEALKRKDSGTKREIKFSFNFDIGTGINLIYEDTGPGLLDEITDPEIIFKPFFSTKRDYKTGEVVGTGLGMWIVKSTIDEYKGEIQFLTVRPHFKIKIILPKNI